MAESKIEVKNLNSSKLSAEEISKAIEKTALSSASIKKPAPTEPEATPTATENPKVESSEQTDSSKGTKIIVKRDSGYIEPPSTNDETDEDKDEAPEEIKPPSQTQKTMAVPSEAVSAQDESKPAKNEEAAVKDDDKEAINTEAKPEESAVKPEKSDDLSAKLETKLEPKEEEPETQQALKVFDTTEYHLPIKASTKKHLNSAVSWTVLILFLAGISAYLLVGLDILKLDDLKLFSF